MQAGLWQSSCPSARLIMQERHSRPPFILPGGEAVPACSAYHMAPAPFSPLLTAFSLSTGGWLWRWRRAGVLLVECHNRRSFYRLHAGRHKRKSELRKQERKIQQDAAHADKDFPPSFLRRQFQAFQILPLEGSSVQAWWTKSNVCMWRQRWRGGTRANGAATDVSQKRL